MAAPHPPTPFGYAQGKPSPAGEGGKSPSPLGEGYRERAFPVTQLI